MHPSNSAILLWAYDWTAKINHLAKKLVYSIRFIEYRKYRFLREVSTNNLKRKSKKQLAVNWKMIGSVIVLASIRHYTTAVHQSSEKPQNIKLRL